MAIDSSITQISGNAASSSSTSTRKTASTLNVDDFLELMIAQLQNQDPTDPMDSTEYVAQLAQFSTVSGIEGMQESLNTLSESLRSSQALSGASLVGHWVLAPGDTATLASEGGALGGGVEVPAGASSVTLNIKDASGQVVRHMTVSATEGLQEFYWDGKDDAGVNVATGKYTFEAIANVGGENESLEMQLYGQVGSVSLTASGTGLTVNTPELGAIALGNVRQIT